MIERSNAFDGWQSAIRALVQESLQKRPEYRQLLGLLCLNLNTKRDLVDHSPIELHLFGELTRHLHAPMASDLHVRWAIAALKKAGLKTGLSLLVDGDSPDATDNDIVTSALTLAEE